MTQYLIFKNTGEISPQEIKTFGMSIKKEGAIGFFGTGLKYAIAISVRLNEPIRIYSGDMLYIFEKETETVRGKSFDFINMYQGEEDTLDSHILDAGTRLAFTTHVGAKWEPWMCVREVLCNCVDEGGTFYYSDELPTPESNVTYVVMSGLFVNIPLEEYALPGNKQLLMSTVELDVYNSRSAFVYYKGIRVEHEPKPYRYTYNIKQDTTLGEDRVAHAAYIGAAVISPILESDNEELIRYVTQSNKESGEGKIPYSSWNVSTYASDTTKKIIRETYKRDGALAEWAKEAAPQLLTEDDHLELVKEASLTTDQTEAFAQAINCIKQYFPIFDYKIRVVSMSDNIYGKAQLNNKIILLNANKLGSENVDEIKKTILEEYLHLRFECPDYGRAWQDGALKMMLELIEHNERKEREISSITGNPEE